MYRNFRTISRGLYMYVVFGPGKVSCGLYKGRLICRRLKNKTGKDRFYCPRRCNYNTYATYRKSGRAQATGPKAFELRLRLRCWWPQLYLFHVELACRQAGRPDRKHRRAWVRAVRWRCRPGLAVNMDQIGMYFNKVLISIVSLSGIFTWTPHNDPFVAMYSQWLASGRPGGLLCVLLVWCGLYDGAAYLSTSESYLCDLGVVRLIPRTAYSPEITVGYCTTGTLFID